MIESPFPRLTGVEQKKTSDPTSAYNCIAWAFGDNTRWWWPQRGCYWPVKYTGMTALEAFDEAFKHFGWSPQQDQEANEILPRIALYKLDGEPTHAAKEIEPGVWSSKLGKHLDLQHSLTDLDGPVYGSVEEIYVRRTLPSA